MRYFISPKNSVAYDKTGVTYPKVIPFDVEGFVMLYGGTNFKWEWLYGRKTASVVLSFSHPARRSSVKIHPLRDALPPELGVAQHWRSWAAQKGWSRVHQTT